MKIAHALLAALLTCSLAATAGCGVRQPTASSDSSGGSGGTASSTSGQLTVSVLDANSAPVSGATVSVLDATGKSVVSPVQSDASGSAVFQNVPAGTNYTVTAAANGVTGQQTGVGVDGTDPAVATVTLAPAAGPSGSISGVLVDGLSNQPVSGGTVSVLGTQNTVQTNPDGSFTLKGVAAGDPTVVAIATGYAEVRQSVQLAGGSLAQANLKLFPSGNPAKLGHTIVSTATTTLEFDKFMNNIANYHRAASEARELPNGDLLMATGGGVAEINASNLVVWNFQPVLFGRLGNPQGVARMANGDTLIADTGDQRVIEVTSGRMIRRVIDAPNLNLKSPMAVDVDATHGTFLITDAGSNRVLEVDGNNQIVWSAGDGTTNLLAHPTDAVRLTNGDTLITDTGNSRIEEVDHDVPPHLVWSYNVTSPSKTACYLPNSAERLGNGDTLIADTGNNRVIEIDKSGNIVFQLPNIPQPLYAERL